MDKIFKFCCNEKSILTSYLITANETLGNNKLNERKSKKIRNVQSNIFQFSLENNSNQL